MSAPNRTAVSSDNAATPAPTAAVLLLDASGRVTSANASARTLWQVDEAELVGEPFASLFLFDIVSEGPEWLEAQWDVVRGAALERTALLTVQPRESGPVNLGVRIEPAVGGAGGYIAVVQPLAAAPTPNGDDGLTLLVEQSAAGYFDLNFKAGQVIYSPVWKTLLGYSFGELADTHETWLTHIHPEDSEAAPYFIGKKYTTDVRRISVEFRMRHRQGHYVWLHCTGLQQVSAKGELDRVVGFCVDVTERREVEEASLANDVRLQDLSTSGPLGAFELNFARRQYWVSPVWSQMLGLGEVSAADALAAFSRTLPDAEPAPEPAAWLAARAPGQSSFFESVELRDANDRPVSVFLGAHRTFTRKRELARVVGFICPLPTSLAALALDEGPALSPQLLSAAFTTLTEAVLITDAMGQVIFVNHAAARLLQRVPADVIGRPVDRVFRLANRLTGRPGDNPVEAALAVEGILPLNNEQALLPGHLFEHTSLPVAVTESPSTLDASPRPIVWAARAVRGPDREPRGVVIVFRDPNEVTLTPDELVRANRFERLGQLAGGIAHDFNNLLTKIMGNIALALKNQDLGSLGDAEKACMAAKGLTQQLLLVAKGGGATLSVVAAQEILDDAMHLAAAGATAAVSVTVDPGTDPVAVDRAEILQVFQNLILNAIQAMPPGPHVGRVQLCARNFTVHEQQISGLPAGEYVEFQFRDNGAGIPPEIQEKIWDPFFTTKKHGTGLGLSTVLSIVRKHGGQIGLSSTVGEGSVFTVYLPSTGRPAEVQARKAPSLRFGTGRILFMDDDEKISTLTGGMLASLDYKYDLAKNGDEAIALYTRYLNIGRPYDVVIMDLTVVAGMGGEDCFKQLRGLDPDVRAIISSGYDHDDIARRYLDMGFCGYLAKPYRVADLGKILKGILS